MGCGSFIVRYGASRISEVALAFVGGGIAVAATGRYWTRWRDRKAFDTSAPGDAGPLVDVRPFT
jgi:hypothetical protein